MAHVALLLRHTGAACPPSAHLEPVAAAKTFPIWPAHLRHERRQVSTASSKLPSTPQSQMPSGAKARGQASQTAVPSPSDDRASAPVTWPVRPVADSELQPCSSTAQQALKPRVDSATNQKNTPNTWRWAASREYSSTWRSSSVRGKSVASTCCQRANNSRARSSRPLPVHRGCR